METKTFISVHICDRVKRNFIYFEFSSEIRKTFINLKIDECEVKLFIKKSGKKT